MRHNRLFSAGFHAVRDRHLQISGRQIQDSDSPYVIYGTCRCGNWLAKADSNEPVNRDLEVMEFTHMEGGCKNRIRKMFILRQKYRRSREIDKSTDSDIFICETCSRIVFDLSGDSKNRKTAEKKRKELAKAAAGTGTVKKGSAATPSEIHRQMDRFIIGQERAKKILSVAVYNHAKRLKDKRGLIKKSNILLVGPSGCGKTLLAKTLAGILDVPFAIADATSMTQAGYVGDNVEICLQRLLDASGWDVELAQKGIVFIDEVDKIACRETGGRDIGGGGVQAALLKLAEGNEVDVPYGGDRRSLDVDCVKIDTTGILFIFGGAFDGLTNRKKKEKHNIGFHIEGRCRESSAKNVVSTEDLVKYGMMPEFVGRMPVICTLDELTEEDFVRILTEPEDAIIKEYELLLRKDGVKLVFEPEAVAEIARTASERKTGARGIRSILEDVMLDVMYQLPDCRDISKCVITAESIKTGQAQIIKKRTRKQKNIEAGVQAQARK